MKGLRERPRTRRCVFRKRKLYKIGNIYNNKKATERK